MSQSTYTCTPLERWQCSRRLCFLFEVLHWLFICLFSCGPPFSSTCLFSCVRLFSCICLFHVSAFFCPPFFQEGVCLLIVHTCTYILYYVHIYCIMYILLYYVNGRGNWVNIQFAIPIRAFLFTFARRGWCDECAQPPWIIIDYLSHPCHPHIKRVYQLPYACTYSGTPL